MQNIRHTGAAINMHQENFQLVVLKKSAQQQVYKVTATNSTSTKI